MTARAAVRFAAHGIRIGVTSDQAEILEAARAVLPPLREPAPSGRLHRAFHLSSVPAPAGPALFSLHAGHTAIVRAVPLRRVLRALEWRLNLCIAERARDRIFVHAGAVEWRGKAIVVPGRSFSGKSTLVAELVRAGCAYLSDEFAVLDRAGVCHAYPRPLSLRLPGGIETRTAEELGGRTRHEPLPVGCILVTQYRQGATWRPLRLSPGAGAMALLQHTVAARARTREVLAVLRASIAGAAAFESARGDAAEVVASLLHAP